MKIEYIAFWILIVLIVGLAVWKLIGSPTDTSSLIALALFTAGSELLLWKAIFKIDKKTSIGFVKLKDDMNSNFKHINEKLNNWESTFKRKK